MSDFEIGQQVSFSVGPWFDKIGIISSSPNDGHFKITTEEGHYMVPEENIWPLDNIHNPTCHPEVYNCLSPSITGNWLSPQKIPIKLLHPDAKIPTTSKGNAGYDLYALEDVLIEPWKSAKIHTGISMKLPDGHVGLLWDRSGLSSKHQIHRLAGVIDSPYVGPIIVCLINLSETPYQVSKHDRIVQMLIQKYEEFDFEVVDELPETDRGEKGFGSSGR